MALLAAVLAILAALLAGASWVAGAWIYARASGGPTWRLAVALVSWPFQRGAIDVELARAQINKALVAFFAMLMLAVAATSVATNIARFSRQAING
jgi:hypothetical protein